MIKIEMKNTYVISGEVTHIEIGSGATVTIDSKNIALVHMYKWYIGSHGYATTTTPEREILMHRLLFKFPNAVVDHLDRDKSNNRELNLRVCSQAQNLMNRCGDKNSISGYKGVSENKSSKNRPWRARININKKVILIGTYPTKEEAAAAYNEHAKKYFKEFAYLNKIE